MKPYHKLVRDRIPEIVKNEGKIVSTQTLTDELFRIALSDKLQESITEYSADPSAVGLVDILEVIYAIAQSKYDLSHLGLEKLRVERLIERGGYDNHTLLIESSD